MLPRQRPEATTAAHHLFAVVIVDARFVGMGLRRQAGSVGRHERDTRALPPVHIGARQHDLGAPVTGLEAFERRAIRGGLDASVAAALLAFGVVSIHPFEDGNGRIPRCLIHHVRARAGFNPRGILLPLSAVIPRRIAAYAGVQESITAPRLELVDRRPSRDGPVEVPNGTAPFHRSVDLTEHAEVLAECVPETIEVDLPQEIEFLKAFDRVEAGAEVSSTGRDRCSTSC